MDKRTRVVDLGALHDEARGNGGHPRVVVTVLRPEDSLASATKFLGVKHGLSEVDWTPELPAGVAGSLFQPAWAGIALRV